MEDLLSLTLVWGTTKTPQNIEAQTPSFYAFVGSYYWIILRPHSPLSIEAVQERM